ncbi:hypothetical protein Dimus_011069 [Dionaea muscipula]
MEAVRKIVNGKEIDLEELEGRAGVAEIQKVTMSSSSCFSLSLQGARTESGIGSLGDAITCRIASRDAL